jgi:hypothetical protein
LRRPKLSSKEVKCLMMMMLMMMMMVKKKKCFVFDLSNCFVLQTNGFYVLTKYTFDGFTIKFQNNVLRT